MFFPAWVFRKCFSLSSLLPILVVLVIVSLITDYFVEVVKFRNDHNHTRTVARLEDTGHDFIRKSDQLMASTIWNSTLLTKLPKTPNTPVFRTVKIRNNLGQENAKSTIDLLVVDDEERRQRELDRTYPGLRRRLPTVLTIGVAKCGTGVTHRFLALNPYLVPSRNESNILAFDDRYKKGFWYHRNFQRESLRHQITIERGTYYLVTPGVPERIKALNESMKLLMIVCNPVVRTTSHFAHRVALHVSKEADDVSFESMYSYANGTLKTSALKYRYDEVIAPWLEYFPKEQILVIDGEKMKTDPLPELRRVETFLGVPHLIKQKNLVVDEKKGFVCILTDFMHCVGKSRGRAHVEIQPKLKSQMVAFYKKHNDKFVQMVGRNFSWT